MDSITLSDRATTTLAENSENSLQITETNGIQTVSARELHERLEIKTPCEKWFIRMCEYGFVEDIDFVTVGQKCPIANGGFQERKEHYISLDMAKQICMLQRTEKGRQYREYFLKLEAAWNSPEMVMKRALQFAQRQVAEMEERVFAQGRIIEEQRPKVEVYDAICDAGGCQDLQTAAAEIGLKNVFKVLVADHILEVKYTEDTRQKYYKPYSKYSAYLVLRVVPWKDSYTGATHARPRVYVTPKGLLWLAGRYAANQMTLFDNNK